MGESLNQRSQQVKHFLLSLPHINHAYFFSFDLETLSLVMFIAVNILIATESLWMGWNYVQSALCSTGNLHLGGICKLRQ